MNPDNLVVGKIYYDKHYQKLIEFVGKINDTNCFIFKSAFVSAWTYHKNIPWTYNRDLIEFQVIPYSNMLKSYLDINNAP